MNSITFFLSNFNLSENPIWPPQLVGVGNETGLRSVIQQCFLSRRRTTISQGKVKEERFHMLHRGSVLNPLSPGIKLQILLLCFHTFLTELVGRSCSNINRISFE